MIPHIMVLDRDPDSQDEVLNIDVQEGAVLITALMDVTISIASSDFPSGTLRFKEGQTLILPSLEELYD
jgi:hypothetical protein